MSISKWITGNGYWSNPKKWQSNAVPTATDDADISGGSPEVRYAITVNSIFSNAGSTGNAALRFVSAGSSTVETDIDLGGESYLTVFNSLVTVGVATSVPVVTVSANAQSGARLTTGTLDAQSITLTGTNGKHAQLTANSFASFGSGSDISQKLSLVQDARIEFAGTAQFTSLSGSLSLSGPKALIADAGISGASNSALRGLGTISGTLQLDQGAQVALTGRLTIQKGARVSAANSATISESGALTNDGNLAVGGGQLHIGSALVNDGLVTMGLYNEESGSDLLDVAGAIYNNGTMSMDFDSREEIDSTLTGRGRVNLSMYANLDLEGAVGRGEAIKFAYSSTLTLGDADHFAGYVRGLTTYDDFVLTDFNSSSILNFTENASGKAGVLTVDDGTHHAHIAMAGNYTNADFNLSAHAGGGVTIAFS